jgi:hypothetical protein
MMKATATMPALTAIDRVVNLALLADWLSWFSFTSIAGYCTSASLSKRMFAARIREVGSPLPTSFCAEILKGGRLAEYQVSGEAC